MDFIQEQKDLNVRLNLDSTQFKSKTTFFFKRLLDEEYIPVEDVQVAWNYYTTRRQDFKYIGQSDGKVFMAGIKEARELFKTQGLEASQERIRKAIGEELEIAKLNTQPPKNADVFGSGAAYLQNNMGKYGR